MNKHVMTAAKLIEINAEEGNEGLWIMVVCDNKKWFGCLNSLGSATEAILEGNDDQKEKSEIRSNGD